MRFTELTAFWTKNIQILGLASYYIFLICIILIKYYNHMRKSTILNITLWLVLYYLLRSKS